MAGPNGSGETTFVHKILLPALPPRTVFVNADEIAQHVWGDDAEARSYDAARIAAATRSELIRSRRPFVAETVFSHPSKLGLIDEAHAAGLAVVLHVLMVPEQVSVQRVDHRVAAGGHRVPEEKIRARYRRLWPLVAQAFLVADSAFAYDNSGIHGPRVVARAVTGIQITEDWPSWCPDEMREIWPRTTQ